MPDEIINTQWGSLYFEDCGAEYIVYPSPEFVRCILYDYVSDNQPLIDAVNAYNLEQEPLLFRDKDEYASYDGAYIDFVRTLESEFGIPVLES